MSGGDIIWAVTCPLSVSGLECEPSADPWREGRCVRCDRMLDRGPLRDRKFEAEIARQLCAPLHIDVHPLVVFAGRRADRAEVEYGRDFPDTSRNLEIEGLEEGSDWFNYLRWRLDGLNRGYWPDQHWKTEHLQEALRHVALAFEATRRALDPEQMPARA